MTNKRSALVTGAGHRIGKAIAESLHKMGFDLILHFNSSREACEALADKMNAERQGSANIIQADLSSLEDIDRLANDCLANHPQLQLLVNNAAPFLDDKQAQSQQQFLPIAAMPFELAMKLKPVIKKNKGQVISILDIYTEKPKRNFYHYSAAKAAAKSYLKALVLELAPEARANGIAPGAILWPDNEDTSTPASQDILRSVPLERQGSTSDIVKATCFLIDCDYINAQVIAVDGGRSINL